jgi:LPS-assembly lipoprotein
MNYKNFIIFTPLLYLFSCGYYLRGTNNVYKIPYNSIYLDCSKVIICDNLKLAIKTQNLTLLTNDINNADAIIKVSNEETSKVPQNYNIAGRIASYRLTYQVSTKILDKTHPKEDITFNVYTSSIMNYNDSTILANNINEQDIWNKMHQNATSQLIRKLIYSSKK